MRLSGAKVRRQPELLTSPPKLPKATILASITNFVLWDDGMEAMGATQVCFTFSALLLWVSEVSLSLWLAIFGDF